MALRRHRRIGDARDGGGRARIVRQHARACRCRRAAPRSAGRTGSCGGGCPDSRRARRNGRRTARARSACASACRPSSRRAGGRAAGRSCGPRRHCWRRRRTARASRSWSAAPVARAPSVTISSTGSPSRSVPPSRSKCATMPRDQRVGAALGEPDAAVALQLVDQGVDRAGRHRIAADEQGVEGQRLAQLLVLHIARDDRIDRAPGLVAGERRARRAASRRNRGRGRRRASHSPRDRRPPNNRGTCDSPRRRPGSAPRSARSSSVSSLE